jgi:hypothetical protein
LNDPIEEISSCGMSAYSIREILFELAYLSTINKQDPNFCILMIFFQPITDMLFSIYHWYRSCRPVDKTDHKLKFCKKAQLDSILAEMLNTPHPQQTCSPTWLYKKPPYKSLEATPFFWQLSKHSILVLPIRCS